MMQKLSLFPVPVVLVAGLLLLTAGCQQSSLAPSEGDVESTEVGGDTTTGAVSAEPVSRAVTLDAGTPLRVRTISTLSTKAAQSGEVFTASLEEPIVDGTWVIAAKGANVKGTVVTADPGGKVKGVARLVVRLTQIEAADGKLIDVSTSTYSTQARQSKKKDAKKVGIASGVGAAIGAIAGGGKGAAIGAGVGAGAGTGAVLATRGDPAVIPSETVLNFNLREPVTIQAKN